MIVLVPLRLDSMKPIKPILSPINARAHDAMHLQHKYWSRKPINVVRKHIEAATRPGELVLDPFCGSGTSVSQALITGRKAVGIDLNPMAIFIARNTITRADLGKIQAIFDTIKKNVKDEIEKLYQTRCTRCLKTETTRTICLHWKVHHPIKLIYTCENCSKRTRGRLKKLSKRPDSEDLTLLDNIAKMKVPCWYPKREIPTGVVFDQAKRSAKYFHELFTKRNLIALSIVFDQIKQLPETTEEERELKSLFKFSFTSMVHLCSKMAPVRPSRPYSSFWATNSYWIPRKFMESNVWLKFESAIEGPQGLIASRRDANKKLGNDVKIVDSLDQIGQIPGKVAYLKNGDAIEMLKKMPENSVDFIFTDPPYADSIPYLELSTLWATWLGMDNNMEFDKEIVVDSSREKNLSIYLEMLSRLFAPAFKALKPGRFLSFTYHNLDFEVRKGMILAALDAGFIMETVFYQPPPRTSPAHTLRPFNSAVGDYIVTFKKPTVEAQEQETSNRDTKSEITDEIAEKEVLDCLTEILIERGEPTTYTQLINSIDSMLARKPALLRMDLKPRDVLKKFQDSHFIKVEVTIGSNKGAKWWLSREYLKDAMQSRGIEQLVPLTDRIKDFLSRNQEAFENLSKEEVIQETYDEFSGKVLPDAKVLKDIIYGNK